MPALADELAKEQAHLDRAYERLAELRGKAVDFAKADLIEYSDAADALVLRERRESHGLLRARELSIEEGLCFGRTDHATGEAFHIGRIGVSDADQTPLVIDWRAPVAEPFYRATPGNPLGLVRRRHLLTRGRRVVGLDDEPLDLGTVAHGGAGAGELVLVGEAALLEAVTQRRTGRMRDIVATIQAEQDEIIRSPLAGVLVVQGGPGTGKTAVALHRAAYLLYRYRFPLEQQGVLVVGPNPVFLRYIERVLPSLGESGCLLTTVDRLYEGDARPAERDTGAVARLKGDVRMASVIARAVESRERPLARTVAVGFGAYRLQLRRSTTARIVDAARAREGTHNERRAYVERRVLRALVHAYTAAAERAGRPAREPAEVVDALAGSVDVRRVLERVWPVLTPERLLDDLFGHPALLREATDGVLGDGEAALLERERGAAPTVDDLPLLDEARALLGDVPARTAYGSTAVAADRSAAASAASAAERVRAELITGRITDDMLGAGELSEADPEMVRRVTAHLISLAHEERPVEVRPLFPKFGHVVVDEAQEVSAMQWRMLARRAASMSMTVVGDLDQASGDAAVSSWDEVVAAVGATRSAVAELRVNYRTPSEVMRLADRLLPPERRGGSGAVCVREAGVEPAIVASTPSSLVDDAVAGAQREMGEVPGGKVGVVAPPELVPSIRERLGVGEGDALDADVTVLDADGAKGLEFDSVVVVEPSAFAARALYVALTRTTTRLTILHATPLPVPLLGAAGAADGVGEQELDLAVDAS